MGSFPDVNVIVPVYKNESGLRLCLDALRSQDYPGRYDIVVIDNEARFSLEHLRTAYPDVKFLWEAAAGSYNARNKGISETTAPILAFTDSDCIPHKNWISAGVQALLSDEGIGLAGGHIAVKLLDPDRKPTIAEYADIIYGFPQDRYFQVGFFPTANMFTKRAVMEKVGVFNGALKSSGDAEWGARATDAGYRLNYDIAIVVDHPARNFRETRAKIRRITGGWRDRNPSWRGCLKIFTWRPAIPLRRIQKVWQYNDWSCSMADRLLISLYLVYLRWYEYYCRLKLQIFKTPSPR